jgi:hypothetical protein
MSSQSSEVFLLSLAFQSFFDSQYAALVDKLHKVTRIKRATKADAAIRYLEANDPKVIIITDEGLTGPQHKEVHQKVLSYIQNGGLVIVGLHFTVFTTQEAFDYFFNEGFNLPWRRGDYHRTTFQFNRTCTLPASVAKYSIPPPYSMKVLHVKDARPDEKVFLPLSGAMTESNVFPAAHVDEAQAAVAATKIGAGFLFYVGDVNGEEESDKLILALCGLSG